MATELGQVPPGQTLGALVGHRPRVLCGCVSRPRPALAGSPSPPCSLVSPTTQCCCLSSSSPGPHGRFSPSSCFHPPVSGGSRRRSLVATPWGQLTGLTVSEWIWGHRAAGLPLSRPALRHQHILTQLLGFGLNFAGRNTRPS